MGTRTTIITFVIAVLCVVAAFVTAGTDRIETSSDAQQRRLLGVDRLPIEQVERITLQRGAQQRWVFERRAGQWWQVEPFEYPMQIFSMRQLISLAVDLEYVSVLEPEHDAGTASLAALSLDPPNAVVTYEWGEESIGFELGRRGIAGRAYVRVVDDPRVFVVNQGLHDRAVEMDPREWRDRTIFRNVSVDAVLYERRNGDERFVLKRDNRKWNMIEPVATRASIAAIEDLFSVLSRIEVGGYMLDQPDDLTRFGLADPIAEIAVTTERIVDSSSLTRQQETQRLLIGSPIGLGSQDRFAMIEGFETVVRLRATVLAELFQDAQTLAARTGSGAQPEDIKRIVIRTADDELMLERDLERWIAPRHGNRVVAFTVVETLLQQLSRLPAPTVEFRQYPRDLEVATVTLHGYDLRPRDTVRIAREPNDGRWAFENGDNVLRIFTATMDIPLTPGDFGLETGVDATDD